MAGEESYKEKRRYARHPGPFDAFSAGAGLHELRVMDLNLGGCFILGGSQHAVGATFPLQIDLGAEGFLEVSATTLYHNFSGSAVTFINLTPEAFGQIQRTVDASWSKPSDY